MSKYMVLLSSPKDELVEVNLKANSEKKAISRAFRAMGQGHKFLHVSRLDKKGNPVKPLKAGHAAKARAVRHVDVHDKSRATHRAKSNLPVVRGAATTPPATPPYKAKPKYELAVTEETLVLMGHPAPKADDEES